MLVKLVLLGLMIAAGFGVIVFIIKQWRKANAIEESEKLLQKVDNLEDVLEINNVATKRLKDITRNLVPK